MQARVDLRASELFLRCPFHHAGLQSGHVVRRVESQLDAVLRARPAHVLARERIEHLLPQARQVQRVGRLLRLLRVAGVDVVTLALTF